MGNTGGGQRPTLDLSLDLLVPAPVRRTDLAKGGRGGRLYRRCLAVVGMRGIDRGMQQLSDTMPPTIPKITAKACKQKPADAVISVIAPFG